MMTNPTFRRAMESLAHVQDPTPPWKDILGNARDVVGADACTFIMLDRVDRPVFMEQVGLDASAEKDYQEYFYKEDFIAVAAADSPVGRWWDTVDLMRAPGLNVGPFYVDFMRKHRMGQISTFVVLAEPERRAAISFERVTVSEEPYAAHAREQYQAQFMVSLLDAVAKRESVARTKFDAIESAFRQVDEAYLLADANGVVFRCSARASDMLNRAGMLKLPQMRLTHKNANAMAGLKRALGRASGTPTGVAYAAPLSWGRALRFDIVPAAAELKMSTETLMLIRLRELSAFRSPQEEELAAFFSLTSAEARVLRGLVAGHSPSEIASASRVSESTIRNQIASLMRKMSCSRQAELVRLATLLL
jgi:DNA-binding CsgD family transcriptional regulator